VAYESLPLPNRGKFFEDNMIQRAVLPNGVVVLTEEMKQSQIAAVNFWIGVGSSFETPLTNGISHFFEHAVFKGTEKKDGLKIVSSIERKGGMINANTSRSSTRLYARVPAAEVANAIGVIGEMLTCPLFKASEMKLEREVILEEIRGTLDSPEELVEELFNVAMWGKTGHGLPVTGTLTSVRRLRRTHLLEHHAQVLNRWPIVVAVAGGVEHQKVVEEVAKALAQKKRSIIQKRGWQETRSEWCVRHRDVQQASVVLGTAFQLKEKKEVVALSLVNALLGGGMSSRLFQAIRERVGLVYAIDCSTGIIPGGAVFSLMYSTEPAKAKKTLEYLSAEWKPLKKQGFTKVEVKRAKEMVMGSMLMDSESSYRRSEVLAKNEFRGYSPESLEERLQNVSDVSLEEVNQMLQKVLVKKQWAGAAVLPLRQHLDLKAGIDF